VTKYQIAGGDSNVVLAPTLSLSIVVAASALIKITTNFVGIPHQVGEKKKERVETYLTNLSENTGKIFNFFLNHGPTGNPNKLVSSCHELYEAFILSLELVHNHQLFKDLRVLELMYTHQLFKDLRVHFKQRKKCGLFCLGSEITITKCGCNSLIPVYKIRCSSVILIH
jgi:hypothetical protein